MKSDFLILTHRTPIATWYRDAGYPMQPENVPDRLLMIDAGILDSNGSSFAVGLSEDETKGLIQGLATSLGCAVHLIPRNKF
jgi:hypothetical protein